ncbi:pimeloyl-ACP methyl ester carboxylesterase [Actinomycetospora succinea]|uniref:Pimeloyl-ACP methyl ester carboxylesterase n=1 Tax=Actinomycetospora succinea TaxID=663603 RepID=A0A4R6VHR8_9PSEU|nr:alpha/beta hydrolase [Actinomycetospora succinea]TDQ62614.1 pimeloyl-ACP methyl ester carboxylesterase [Actinomycetospora succinea]
MTQRDEEEDGGYVEDVLAGDGTRLRRWDNGAAGVPVVLSNGLGASATAWPFLHGEHCGYHATTWYHRGLGGSARPADESHIRVGDHADDLIATLDAAGMDRAVVVGWSVGVAVAIEAARRAPDRVAGLLALGGVATGVFRVLPAFPGAIPGVGVPEGVHRRAAQLGGWLLRVVGPPISGVIDLLPRGMDASREALERAGMDAASLDPTGAAAPMITLAEVARQFARHDWTWFSRMVLAAADHEAPDDAVLRTLTMPVTVVAGDYDTLAPPADMAALASVLPDARLVRLPGSHFLPLQFREALAGELAALAGRAGLAQA